MHGTLVNTQAPRWRPKRRLSVDKLREQFPDESACRRFLEETMWPEGRFCPHCGSLRSGPIRGRKTRPGLYQCSEPECRQQFTVTTKTPLHATKLPLWKWIQAIYFMLESSKGVSSVIMADWLGISQKSAWKICHAVRLLLSQRYDFDQLLSGTVELDDKFFGGAPRFKKGVKHKRGKGTKKQLIGIAAQRLGPVRAVLLVNDSEANLREFVGRVVSPDARIMSDAAGGYSKIGQDFADHRSVVHSKKEFARRDDDLEDVVHSNSAEAFGSMLERALIGVFHRVGKKHIHRYVDEAAFRWNQRTARHDENGELLGFEKLPFELQLKKVLRRAPGNEIRFSDMGGICSPEERKHQTAKQRDRYYILPGCGWVQFKRRRKRGVREIKLVTPDDDVRKAFWSRYDDQCAPRLLYRTEDGEAWMPGSKVEFCTMIGLAQRLDRAEMDTLRGVTGCDGKAGDTESPRG